MSLYLTIFRAGEEVEGWVVGHYSDFACFRDTIAKHLSAPDFPLFMGQSDCDGEWSLAEIPPLKEELRLTGEAFKSLPAEVVTDAFEHTKANRRGAKNLYDCFQNVDGENLFEALRDLCDLAVEIEEPILLQ